MAISCDNDSSPLLRRRRGIRTCWLLTRTVRLLRHGQLLVVSCIRLHETWGSLLLVLPAPQTPSLRRCLNTFYHTSISSRKKQQTRKHCVQSMRFVNKSEVLQPEYVLTARLGNTETATKDVASAYGYPNPGQSRRFSCSGFCFMAVVGSSLTQP